MSVTYQYPKLRLATQLREAGGMAVADAVEAAAENLVELRPQGVTDLKTAVAAALAAFHSFPKQFDAPSLDGLYAIAARAVGAGAIAGAPAADAALVSLCDLLDRLGVARRWDLEPIAVHVQTLQLLAANAGGALDAAATDRVLAGLRRVSDRYRDAPVAASA